MSLDEWTSGNKDCIRETVKHTLNTYSINTQKKQKEIKEIRSTNELRETKRGGGGINIALMKTDAH